MIFFPVDSGWLSVLCPFSTAFIEGSSTVQQGYGPQAAAVQPELSPRAAGAEDDWRGQQITGDDGKQCDI